VRGRRERCDGWRGGGGGTGGEGYTVERKIAVDQGRVGGVRKKRGVFARRESHDGIRSGGRRAGSFLIAADGSLLVVGQLDGGKVESDAAVVTEAALGFGDGYNRSDFGAFGDHGDAVNKDGVQDLEFNGIGDAGGGGRESFQ